MQEIVPVVLATWVAATIAIFWWRPGRDSALISIIGGWAVLPTAIYPVSVFADPAGSGGSMHALAIPTAIVVNKALAIGLGCLIGVVLFDWPAVRRVRLVWLDAPMLAWCMVPIASSLANALPLSLGLAQARYLALAWGVPYALGRIYLGGNESLRRLGLGLVLAGLVYVPLGLLEFVDGPFLYDAAYGAHPYQREGATRLLQHRPLVFLEHGNQLGIWIATAAVAAVWLGGSGRLRSIANIPGGVATAVLVVACLAFQSSTAIALVAAVLVALILTRRSPSFSLPRPAYAVMAAAALLIAMAGIAAVAAAESRGWTGLRIKVQALFREMGKTSFTWRLARSEEHLARAGERPLLGRCVPDWSAAANGTFVNPVNVGLWLLSAGMYGAAGLICSTAILLLPVEEVLRKLPASAWLGASSSAVALSALLLIINAFDSLLNSVLLLPLLACAGGINSWSAGMRDERQGASRR